MHVAHTCACTHMHVRCRYVDEVVIGAPPAISTDLLKTFGISVVVRGSVSETSSLGPSEQVRPRPRP